MVATDGIFKQAGYALGAAGYSQDVAWLYHTRFPAVLPGQSASTPVFTNSQWRGQGPQYFNSTAVGAQQSNAIFGQWGQDFATKSTFSGSVAGTTLTLSSVATGPMWEGEVIDCVTPSGCPLTAATGVYIVARLSGAWGANLSTYTVSNPAGLSASGPMQNAVYDPLGTAGYIGPLNDVPVQQSALTSSGYAPHMSNGPFGGRRAGARWACQVWGLMTTTANCSGPTLARTNDSAAGTPSPAFDYTNTYAASHAATWSSGGATITVTGGLAAHARPFVVGQALTFSAGGGTGFFITSLSVPPSQATASGAGEVGQTFTMTVANGSGGTLTGTSGTVTGGCAPFGGSGGSNCINFDFKQNTTNGTFGTAWALATCGENNLNGPATPNYAVPNGTCQTNGIGSLVRTFRIGTSQPTWGNPGVSTPGTVYDDGADPNTTSGQFNQSAAFTCNIVAAAVVQCVKGANYDTSLHTLIGIGKWTSGSTYAAYGDWVIGTSRIGTLMGSPGGQPLPFTAGTVGTNGTAVVAGTGCTVVGASVPPKIDITIAGGAIINAYPSTETATQPMGLGIGGGCAFTASGTGNTVSGLTISPFDGAAGYGTNITDQNMMGDLLYDNSGLPGNPLNPFFTNSMGGYWEPGLPAQPFGNFMGAAVSG